MADPIASTYLRGDLAAPERTLMDVLRATAAEHPEAAALDDGDVVMTYSDLIAEVDETARWLGAKGIGAGDRVGVRMPSGNRELYVAILSILAAGAAYVPVDADDPDERAEMVFGEAGIAGWFGADGLHLTPGHVAKEPAREPTPDDDAWIIFTSGSTGKPKGVAVTHRSAAAFVDAESRLFLANHPDGPLGPEDRVLAGLSVAFDASCEEMWIAWAHGSCLVPAPRSLVRSGMDLGPWLISRSITAVSTVPTLAGLWPAEALDSVRLLIVGGEACPAELVERLSTPEREVWNTYGPTEATVVACAAELKPGEPVTIGMSLDGWDLVVVDKDEKPVAAGEVGELVIGGVGLARYLDPVKDAEKYAPMPTIGWDRAYRTGDHVRLEPEGLHFVGRVDDQVKIGGRRIELGEVEAHLAALPGVTQASVQVRQTAGGQDILVGYVGAGGDAANVDADAAMERLRAEMPAAMVPRLHVMDELPVRTSGKVDKAGLPWPLPIDAGAADDSALEGLSPIEAWLSGIWAEVLAVPAPGAAADFFALGGTSLAAATVVARMRERAPHVAVRDLYDHPRLGRLAEELESRGLSLDDASEDEATAKKNRRVVKPVPRSTRHAQSLAMVPLQTIRAAKWMTWLAVLNAIAHGLGSAFALPVPWWLAVVLALLFITPLGTLPLTALATRMLMRGVTPGDHPRGGRVHMKLWAAERLADASGARGVGGAPWMLWFARAMGAKVGKGVSLHTLPPVTGFVELGDYCSVEPETDISGYWVDGDVVHVGSITIGSEARIGARCTLMPGTVVGDGAHVEAGSCVTGVKKVKAGARWSGSPARKVGRPKRRFPVESPPRRAYWLPVYGVSALILALVPVAALATAAAIIGAGAASATTWAGAIGLAFAWTAPAAIAAVAVYALLTLILVRLLSIGLKAGVHPVRSRVGWQAWATERLMDAARTDLFPLYASQLTPWWLRALGAKVGRDAEISTAVVLPKFTDIREGSFLADDTMVGGYELGGGWLLLEETRIGRRSFLGNSGIAGPGRKLGKNSLVAVLSSTPKKAKAGSNWWGSPPERLRRVAVEVDGGEDLTYRPGFKVKAARGAVETLRLLAPITSLLLAVLVLLAMQGAAVGVVTLADAMVGVDGAGQELLSVLLGLAVAWFIGSPVLLIAGMLAMLITVAMKWICVGTHEKGEHALWSRFVWFDELQDTFVETVAAPWYLVPGTGTGGLNRAMRWLGADVAHGVWLESYWLPETDLIRIGEGATVGRGCVVQTHLFQDRVMSLDTVEIAPGATLGPHSVALPASRLGESTAIGPASLVMRGDVVPAGTRWQGNPIEPMKEK